MGLAIPGWLSRASAHPTLFRNVVLVLTAACVVVYAAIGAGLIYGQSMRTTDDGPQLWVFGFSAAAMFALGLALMLLRPGRLVWALGALWMVGVIVMYINVAPTRDPHYEIWGISLKIDQAITLVALLGLLVNDTVKRRAVLA